MNLAPYLSEVEAGVESIGLYFDDIILSTIYHYLNYNTRPCDSVIRNACHGILFPAACDVHYPERDYDLMVSARYHPTRYKCSIGNACPMHHYEMRYGRASFFEPRAIIYHGLNFDGYNGSVSSQGTMYRSRIKDELNHLIYTLQPCFEPVAPFLDWIFNLCQTDCIIYLDCGTCPQARILFHLKEKENRILCQKAILHNYECLNRDESCILCELLCLFYRQWHEQKHDMLDHHMLFRYPRPQLEELSTFEHHLCSACLYHIAQQQLQPQPQPQPHVTIKHNRSEDEVDKEEEE